MTLMTLLRTRNRWVVLAGLLLVSGTVIPADAGVIAYWRFEPGSITADSSGNGHTLTNNGAVSSPDVPPGGGSGSAYFNGTSASMQTAATLDLTPYKHISISWWQKVQTSNLAVLWEHSENYNSYPGGLIADVNESGYSPAYVATRGSASSMMDTFPYTSDKWEHITAQINLGLPSGNTHEVVKVYKDGVLVGTDKLTAGAPASFINSVFYLGARAGTANRFKGYFDEFMISTVSPYVNMVANHPNLVGYWRLGESSGTTAWEVKGLTGNGTYTNFAPGDYSKPGAIRFDLDTAVAFNGTNSYVNAGNDADLNGAWSGLTIAAWVYPDTASLTGTHAIAAKWTNTVAGDHFGLFLTDGKPLISVADGVTGESGLTAQRSLVADQWQFVVGTWDASTRQYQIYINGLLDPAVGMQKGNGINTNSIQSLIIGAQVTGMGRYFKGWIDEVAIYKSVLTPQEIWNLYATAIVPEPSSWVLGGLGLMAWGGLVLRRKRKHPRFDQAPV